MKKRDTKRQAILDTAYRLFRTQGFDKTSVSEITAQVGGSKATIYSHFPSKEELFVECMMAATEEYILNITTLLDASGSDPRTVLREFGTRLLNLICSSEIVDVRRLLIAEANRFGIGKLFYAKVTALRAHVAVLLPASWTWAFCGRMIHVWPPTIFVPCSKLSFSNRCCYMQGRTRLTKMKLRSLRIALSPLS